MIEELVLPNDPIRKFQHDLRECSERAERLRPIVKSCEEAIQRAEVKATVILEAKPALRPRIQLMMFCEKLDDTLPLFRELAKEGLRTDKSDTHKDHNLFDSIAFREYNLGPDVSVLAALLGGGEDGPKCRMEKVGVKEVPVYEMKCD